MNGYGDQRDTRDKGMVGCVFSMEMDALGVESLGDVILLRWDDTIMHTASRTGTIHVFSPMQRLEN